jgi:uncharacterized membrane protein
MGFFKDIFNLTEDLLSIPTDIVGLTNHHDKKKALQIAREKFLDGEITATQYEQVKKLINE